MILKGYELVFKGLLTIEKKRGGRVPLGIWEVNEEHVKALDRYEGYPYCYYKTEVAISGKKKGFIYIMNNRGTSRPCSYGYYDICAEGYRDFGFDEKFLSDALRKALEENKR